MEEKQSNRNEWALAFRDGILYRGHNTNNYSEAAMLVIKDNILHRYAYSYTELWIGVFFILLITLI